MFHRESAADCGADSRRDCRPAGLSGSGGPGLPDARSGRREPQRRRIAARAAGRRLGLGPGGRVLRARRTFDRPPPPRQRPVDRHLAGLAVARQHRGGGGARRDDHAPCRLAGGPWARSGPARRTRRGPRRSRPDRGQSPFADRAVSGGLGEDSAARTPPPHGQEPGPGARRRHDQQPQERQRAVSACRRWCALPG